MKENDFSFPDVETPTVSDELINVMDSYGHRFGIAARDGGFLYNGRDDVTIRPLLDRLPTNAYDDFSIDLNTEEHDDLVLQDAGLDNPFDIKLNYFKELLSLNKELIFQPINSIKQVGIIFDDSKIHTVPHVPTHSLKKVLGIDVLNDGALYHCVRFDNSNVYDLTVDRYYGIIGDIAITEEDHPDESKKILKLKNVPYYQIDKCKSLTITSYDPINSIMEGLNGYK